LKLKNSRGIDKFTWRKGDWHTWFMALFPAKRHRRSPI